MSAKNLYRSLLLLALAFALPSAALAVPPPDTATVTPTETATMTPSPSPTLTAVCGSTFGCGACATTSGSAPFADWFYASQFTLATDGNVNSISIFHSLTNGGKVRTGIYSDQGGNLGQLLAQSEEISNVYGWNDLNLNPVFLSAGTYWIGAAVQERARVYDVNSTEHCYSVAYGYGPLPASAPSGGSYGSAHSFVLYASYCPGPPLFLTPTPTATPTQTPIQFAPAGSIGKTVLGPVPAQKGKPICLFYPKTPKSSTWEVYNLTGQLVSSLSFGLGEAGCWAIDNVAPGIYVVRAQIGYVDASAETVTQKVVVLP